ncbi:RluA family pseudouridine synthase [Komarekiella sp. 'clone 1']|uniref:RNA pseudouridylate synthase n=1 Tax=Komarekiella delphini-convector SJRDD-AB1 TaxID=2593771 RepID=A0AA40SWS0_9NOST|nr:RluA family pseudouridine synthase [Komarekiella delphini-convector]MBD6616432.1 RluA family pseudouridine synthase [Komarekiella delphini-convector SJRDD-AB1]
MPYTVLLHALADFMNSNCAVSDLSVSYYYEGYCPQTGKTLRLPRTPMAEAIAHGLMQHLAKNDLYNREGKMYGILLVELPTGEQRVLKAFSGLLNGYAIFDGWVPPIPGRSQVALEEARTLAQLDAIKQELITLKQLTERQQYEVLLREFEQQLQQMSDRHRYCKHQRQEKRQLLYEKLQGGASTAKRSWSGGFLRSKLRGWSPSAGDWRRFPSGQTSEETLTAEALTIALEQLDAESRLHGIERRQLKRQQNEVLQPLKQLITTTDERMRELKQQRKALSQQLQAQMHAAYSLTNFSRQSLSLQQLMPFGMPTGTGDCCAPKLLHYAATHELKPLAMAEFWWGASSMNQNKVQGEFYGACVERCQPLMGFLLSGLKPNLPRREGEVLSSFSRGGVIPIVYEDEWLIAVNKPPGLLSVPGRYRDRQDSVVSRLRHLLPDGIALAAVHRLDQETSGILLLACDRQTHRQLSRQFQQRQIYKVYEAVVTGSVTTAQGVIELPLWGDPQNRPYQQVDWQRGKPSLTKFQVIAREGDYTRVEFIPLTGRTHQLRVHAADSQGLGVTILGDRLYGCDAVANRLHLHARELRFEHPQSGQTLHLRTKTPF